MRTTHSPNSRSNFIPSTKDELESKDIKHVLRCPFRQTIPASNSFDFERENCYHKKKKALTSNHGHQARQVSHHHEKIKAKQADGNFLFFIGISDEYSNFWNLMKQGCRKSRNDTSQHRKQSFDVMFYIVIPILAAHWVQSHRFNWWWLSLFIHIHSPPYLLLLLCLPWL